MDISRDQDDNERRWYEHDGNAALSVTQILGIALEEDDTGLKYWRNENDGQGDSAWWEHLFWYSGPRGTLAHYQALKKFEDVYDGDELWGMGEAKAMKKIVNGPDEDDFDLAPTDNDAVTYSILKDQNVVEGREQYEMLFSDTTIVDVLNADLEYFVDTFDEACEMLGITPDNVITIKHYVFNESEARFGGQTDLVYEDPNGDVVVADLKTSSGLRQKHRLQSVAYSKAVENAPDVPVDDVDRLEVIRIDPDEKEWIVHGHEYPSYIDEENPHYTTDHWFEDKWGDFEYDSIDDMWQTFTDLSDEAHERVDVDGPND